MKLSSLVIAGVFGLLTLGLAGQSFAVCNQYGKVYRVYSRTVGTSNYSYFYLATRSTGLPSTTYYVYASSLDSEGADTLRAASISGETVYVSGTSTTCGTGTFRYMGALNYTYKYKNY